MVNNSVIVRFCGLRLGYANDPAGKTTTGVPGRLRFQIISLFVDDDSVTNDRVSAGELHHLVIPFEMSLARRIRFNVAQIAGMAIARVGGTVRLVRLIKMAAGGISIAGGTIAKLVDVETVFAGCQTSNISNHFYFIAGFG